MHASKRCCFCHRHQQLLCPLGAGRATDVKGVYASDNNGRDAQVLPGLMVQAGVQFWLLSMKEYSEDVVWRSIAPANQINAR